jgi:hypothetical protein
MTADSQPKSLSEIAQNSGLTMSDVAVFSGLDESTVYRLWNNLDWLDRVSGRSLQSLLASVPGMAEYSMTHAIRKRRATLVADLESHGLTVDPQAMDTSTVAQQYLLNALELALYIVREESTQKIASYIARFWGTEPDRALAALYSTERGHGLLNDPHKLVESSIELAPRLNGRNYSFHSILALNILTHQVTKVTGAVDEELTPQVPGRRAAFMIRGAVMGSLISSNDLDLAERYRRELDATPVCAALEEWAFPTYTRDGRVTPDFALPGRVTLRNTAAEVLREISTYNDAYLYYLVSTYLPLALRRDPTFGARITDLITALEQRGADCRDRRILDAGGKLVKRLKNMV